MNKVFKSVWNASLGVWVAVSETAAGQKKGSNKLKKAAANAVATVAIGAASVSGTHAAGWANANGNQAIVGDGSISIGAPAQHDSSATGDQTVVIGGSVDVINSKAVAVGYDAQIGGDQSVALGFAAKAEKAFTTAIGAKASAYTQDSLAFGYNSSAGKKLLVDGNGDPLIDANGNLTYQLERVVAVDKNGQPVVNPETGEPTYITGTKVQEGKGAIAIGSDSVSIGENSIALGTKAVATNKNSIAIGSETTVDAEGAIAIGSKSTVGAKGAIVIGTGTAVGLNSLVFGGGSALAEGAKVFGGGIVEATGEHSIAIGTSTVAGSNSIAIGNNSRIARSNTYILGGNASGDVANSVVLGESSVLTKVYHAEEINNPEIRISTFNEDANGDPVENIEFQRKYEMKFAGTATLNPKTNQVEYLDSAGKVIGVAGAVSVGLAGAERQIQHVGAGRISSSSTDAINGSQLYAVLHEVGKVEEIATKPINFINVDADGKPLAYEDVPVLDANGQPTFDADGNEIKEKVPVSTQVKLGDTFNIQGAKVTLDADGNPILSVDAAAAASWNIASGDVAQASSVGGNANTVNFVGGDNVTVAHSELKDKDGNVIGTQVDVKLADQIQLTENGGLTIAGVPELDPNTGFALTDPNTGLPIYQAGKAPITINQGNVNFGGNVISGVAPGVAGTDAVNVDQLKGSGWGLGNATVLDVAGNVVTDANGQPVTTAKINPDDQVEHKAGASNNVTVNTTVQKVELTDENGDVVLDANGQPVLIDKATVTVDLADQIDLTEKGGLTIAGGGEFNLLDADGKPIQATDADGKPLTNLDGSPQYLTYTPDAINLQQGNVSFGGNQIHDVAAGSALTDAVNVSQLKDAVDTLGGGAGVNPDGTIKAPEYTVGAGNQKVDNVGAALDVLNQGFTLTSSNATGAADEKIQAGDKVDITVTQENKNLVAKQEGSSIEFALADKINLSQDGGLTIAGGKEYNLLDADGNPLSATYVAGNINLQQGNVSFGGNQIHNVAAGTAPTDAVNVSQLQSAGWNIITQDKDAAGNVTGTIENAVNGDKAANNSSVQFNGDKNISVSQTSKDVVDANGNVVGSETIIAVELDKDVNLSKEGSLTIGNTLVNNSGLAIGGGKFNLLDANGNPIQAEDAQGNPLMNPDGSPVYVTQMLGGISIQQGNISFGGNRLQNVATGVDGTDAVNVDQLKDEIGKAVADSGWTLTTAGDSTSAEKIKPNDTVDFSGDALGNIQVSNTGGNVTIALDPTVDLTAAGSLTIGDTLVNNDGLSVGDTSVNKDGLTVAGNGVAKLDAAGNVVRDQDGNVVYTTGTGKGDITVKQDNVSLGGNQINNVARADEDHQAVNLGQLKDELGGLENTINKNIDESIANSGWNLTGKDAAGNTVTEKVNPDDVVEFVAGPSGNTTVTTETTANGAKVTVDIADQLNLTEQGGLTIAGGGVFNALDANGNPIQAKDADGKPLTNPDGSPQYVTYTPDAITIQQGNVSVGGNQIHNVAAGTAGTDAVNVDQLKGAVNIFGGGAAVNPDGSIQAPTYNVNGGSYNNVGDALGALNQADIDLGDRVTNLQQSFNNRIDDVEDRMSAGIAAAMALETAPYVPGKYTYAAATAYHNGQAALGVTLRKTADNGRWSLTGGVAAGTEGEPSVRLGVSGIID